MSSEEKLHELEIRVAKLESQVNDFIPIKQNILQLAFVGAIAGLVVVLFKIAGVAG